MGCYSKLTKNWSKVVSLPEELGGETVIYGLNGSTSMYAIVGQPLGVFKAEAVERDPQGRIVADANTGLPVAAAEFATYGDMNNRYQIGCFYYTYLQRCIIKC